MSHHTPCVIVRIITIKINPNSIPNRKLRIDSPLKPVLNMTHTHYPYSGSLDELHCADKITRASRNLPGDPSNHAAFGNGRISAVGDASATASWPAGAAGGVTLGKSTDAVLAAACNALVDKCAYLIVTFGSLWPRIC
jgi:hypothetical protein